VTDLKNLISMGASARLDIHQLHIHLGDPLLHADSRARMELHMMIAKLPADLLPEAQLILSRLEEAQPEQEEVGGVTS